MDQTTPTSPIKAHVYIGTNYIDGPEKKFFYFVYDMLARYLVFHHIAVFSGIIDNHAKSLQTSWLDKPDLILVNIVDKKSDLQRSHWTDGNPKVPVLQLTADFSKLGNKKRAEKIVKKIVKFVRKVNAKKKTLP